MKSFLFFVFICFVFSSCTAVKYNAVVKPIDISSVLNAVKEKQQKIKTVKGVASIRIVTPSESVSFRQIILIEKDLRYRFEILGAFGKTIGALISDGNRVYLVTSRDRMTFEDVHSFNLSYFYPEIPSYVNSLVFTEVMLGKVPLGLWNSHYILDIEPVSGMRMLTVTFRNSLGSKTKVYINPEKKRIEKAALHLPRGGEVEISYGKFVKTDGVEFPTAIEISSSAYRIKITYINPPRVNGKVDLNMFSPI